MPSNVVTPADLYIGRGEVYFDRFDANGARTGERFLGNCTTFEIQNTDDVRDKYSSAEATAPLLKSINVRRTPEVSIELDEFSVENLSLAFMGTSGLFAQTTASPTNIAVPTGRIKQGYWFPLESPAGTPRKGSVAAPISGVVVKVSAAAKTITTDYLVDLIGGRIYVVPGGSITDGIAALTTDFIYPTLTTQLPLVTAGVSNFIEGYMRFVGTPATGGTYEVEVWKVSLSPDGAMPLIGDDFANFRLKAKVLADTAGHPTEPYYRAYRRS